MTGVLCVLGSLAIPVAATVPVAGAATADSATGVSAYWLVAADGGIFSFGGAQFYGSTGSMVLNKPVVGMAATPDSKGYWLVASDGGIFSFGDAAFHGSTGSMTLNAPIVGMAATHDGGGYWLVASDGGIFAFGDAQFYGSMGGHPLNQPVVGMAATPDGGGYWMVAADGGIFSFGDAQFYGSTGSIHLNQPIVGMTAAPSGGGYWFTAADGGVFAFGDAPFYGSLGGHPKSRPIVAMSSTGDGGGYWFTDSNGLVSAFGDATYWGSAPQILNQPVVGMAEAVGNGSYTRTSYQQGSYGYDISNWQCGNFPPAPHAIGIVEVVGASMGGVNPCLASEAAWAGAGLNLYIYLTYGTAASSGDPACSGTASPASCNYGYETALDAFQKAQAAGIDTSVEWWLDVEGSWSASTSANQAMLEGAVDGLHFEGLNAVGIYTSPLTWPGIVGNYQPKLPVWLAWYTGDPQQSCATGYSYAAAHGSYLPTGGILITQYASGTFDEDYAC
ncbi:MAG: hypothetical protein ACLQPH_03880 [Acidimicrobiales bacterium]